MEFLEESKRNNKEPRTSREWKNEANEFEKK